MQDGNSPDSQRKLNYKCSQCTHDARYFLNSSRELRTVIKSTWIDMVFICSEAILTPQYQNQSNV